MSETLEPALPDELDEMAEREMRRLCDRGLTVATAESCTGGMLASLLTDIHGCAHGFDRGFVTYSPESKQDLLGLDRAIVEENEAVNPAVARAMAEGALGRCNADIALAVTGFAGPGGDDHEEGLVYVGQAMRGREAVVEEHRFGPIGRGPIRLAALNVMLQMLGRAIDAHDQSHMFERGKAMTDLVFYTNPMSRGQIVRWMLEEVGASYETKILGYTELKDPDYLLVNPMGKVPAIRHGDKVVTETAAICAYLADAFPAANLGPRSDERADYYRWLFFAAGPVEQAVTNRHLGVKPTPDQQRMTGYGSFELTIDVLDGWLSQRSYVCGSRFTAADVVIGSQIMWGMQFGTMPRRPSFAEYAARLSAREAYQRAQSIDQQLIAALQEDQVPSEG